MKPDLNCQFVLLFLSLSVSVLTSILRLRFPFMLIHSLFVFLQYFLLLFVSYIWFSILYLFVSFFLNIVFIFIILFYCFFSFLFFYIISTCKIPFVYQFCQIVFFFTVFFLCSFCFSSHFKYLSSAFILILFSLQLSIFFLQEKKMKDDIEAFKRQIAENFAGNFKLHVIILIFFRNIKFVVYEINNSVW